MPAGAVKLRVMHTGVGGITETDILLAAASKAIVIGFNIRPEPKAAALAEREGVDVRLYSIIYDALNLSLIHILEFAKGQDSGGGGRYREWMIAGSLPASDLQINFGFSELAQPQTFSNQGTPLSTRLPD